MKNDTFPSPLSAGIAGKKVIIQDTREKIGQGWFFPEDMNFGGTIRKKLDTGDYSVIGHEDKFTIDRKARVSELAANLTQKRFKNEMDRMKNMDVAIVLMQFTEEQFDEWPYNAGLSKDQIKKVRTSAKFLRKKIHEFEDYGVRFIFGGEDAYEIAYRLLLEVAYGKEVF